MEWGDDPPGTSQSKAHLSVSSMLSRSRPRRSALSDLPSVPIVASLCFVGPGWFIIFQPTESALADNLNFQFGVSQGPLVLPRFRLISFGRNTFASNITDAVAFDFTTLGLVTLSYILLLSFLSIDFYFLSPFLVHFRGWSFQRLFTTGFSSALSCMSLRLFLPISNFFRLSFRIISFTRFLFF